MHFEDGMPIHCVGSPREATVIEELGAIRHRV